ncbi:MAG: DUF309 domain-containing protein [Gemmataceae bacterium]
MHDTNDHYDPRYLAGILVFNDHDFFEAHEIWEAVWMETTGPERRFYQGLIQAAVGLCHFGNGNLRGAVKLYHSSRDYLAPYRPTYLGMDVDDFWRQMDHCHGELLARPEGGVELDEEKLPRIVLDPPPTTWPDPADYLEEE